MGTEPSAAFITQSVTSNRLLEATSRFGVVFERPLQFFFLPYDFEMHGVGIQGLYHADYNLIIAVDGL